MIRLTLERKARGWSQSQLARQSTHINQRSGVSVRLSIANFETLEANAARHAPSMAKA